MQYDRNVQYLQILSALALLLSKGDLSGL